MNNDLINRSALMEKLSIIKTTGQEHPVYFLWRYALTVALRVIKTAPAVDAVEVVRCEKCQHYKKQYKSEDKKCCTINAEYDPDVGVWYGLIAYPPPDFYCADGERRTE